MDFAEEGIMSEDYLFVTSCGYCGHKGYAYDFLKWKFGDMVLVCPKCEIDEDSPTEDL